MRVEELRIGNLIECEQGDVGTVDEIRRHPSCERDYEHIVKVRLKNSYFTPTEYIDRFKPIPLTEEWLMKFGFEKKVDYEQSEDEWGIISSINSRRGVGLYQPDEYKDKCPNYFFVTFREDVGCGWNDLNEVEYVHQLQNLYFALTGEELTIK